MARTFFVFGLILLAIGLQFCATPKKVQVKETQKPKAITFDANIKPLIITKCSPCHLDDGKEISYDNYASAKENITDIIRRIKLNPTDHGFMPIKNPKLSDSLIHVFEQWKIDNLLEK